jgi:hypothetical protein
MSGSSFTACAVFAAALRVADAGEMVFFAFDDHATPWMEGPMRVVIGGEEPRILDMRANPEMHP